jgi:hypothetical protein
MGKWVIVAPLDQTIGFIAADGSCTNKHKDAKLFDTKAEAEAANAHKDVVCEVLDVPEFLSREDVPGW